MARTVRGAPQRIMRRPVQPIIPVCSWEEMPVICTTADVARLFSYGQEKIQRMAKNGELPAFVLGNEWRFRRQDLEAYVAEQTRAYAESFRLKVAT